MLMREIFDYGAPTKDVILTNIPSTNTPTLYKECLTFLKKKCFLLLDFFPRVTILNKDKLLLHHISNTLGSWSDTMHCSMYPMMPILKTEFPRMPLVEHRMRDDSLTHYQDKTNCTLNRQYVAWYSAIKHFMTSIESKGICCHEQTDS